MNKSQLTLSIIGIVLLIMASTNPSIEAHRSAVFNKMKDALVEENTDEPKNKFQQLGESIGLGMAQKMVDNMVERDNYFFFSITKIQIKEEEKIIGVGLFGSVWIKSDFNKDSLHGEMHSKSAPNLFGSILILVGLLATIISLLGNYDFETKHIDTSDISTLGLLMGIVSIMTGLFLL